MSDMFGSSPKTYMTDSTVERHLKSVKYKKSDVNTYIENVLQLEAVACKDWLTNKVDRSVTGKVARQQCQGEIQLPLSDCGVVALDYTGTKASQHQSATLRNWLWQIRHKALWRR